MTECLLLDIEGTTCPVTFVADVLFPYAQTHLSSFLAEHGDEVIIQDIAKQAWREWEQDSDNTAQAILQEAKASNLQERQALENYWQLMIKTDRKATSLKDLQGHLWAEGFQKGDIKADLYPETITSLKRWKKESLKLAVYSSGSIKAQQLLYAHTTSGDLRELFSGWFDTHTGSKKETTSYVTIANQLKIAAASITFISDNGVECDAAHEAGMQVLFSLRPGNPDQNPRGHRVIRSLEQVDALI
ncbi:acireductone synthase [Synechococcus sp. BS55D]|uniref:acireductone synthase n=1 Tax=Synechococcus sp. BS55D TaxID=2055943 RepID=UPI00103E16B8|nr:acireductone synthase [Synechococcus sp. BS55D]TCD55144.1 acireductone synthase [Synechococcus sp. BS55D]